MSKIRTVKPELFRHEQLFEAEQNSEFPLRLIFIGLFTVADAAGRFRWRPRQLKLDILPYDDINFSAALSALAEFGFVQRYECQGECYGYIPSWRKHQSINQREPESVLPDPQRGTAMHAPTLSIQTYSERNMSAYVAQRTAHADLNIASSQLSTAESSANIVKSELNSSSNSLIGAIEPKAAPLLVETPSMTTPMPNNTAHMPDTATHMHSLAAYIPASLEMEMEMEMEVEEEVELEKEMEGKWKKSTPPHLRAVPDPVMLVFEHWQRVMDHPKAVLDKQRRRFIRLALDKGYSVDDLCQAITGCSFTPHNRGHNDRGERYDGLHLILRSADQIDRFIRNSKQPPKLLNKAEQRLQGNVQAAQTWLQKEEGESEHSR